MERQIRQRIKTTDVKTLLIKLLPLLFFIMILIMASSMTGALASGPARPTFE